MARKRDPRAGSANSPWRKQGGWPPVLRIPDDAAITGIDNYALPDPGAGSNDYPVWLPPYETDPEHDTGN